METKSMWTWRQTMLVVLMCLLSATAGALVTVKLDAQPSTSPGERVHVEPTRVEGTTIYLAYQGTRLVGVTGGCR